jgi:hypothetical protein
MKRNRGGVIPAYGDAARQYETGKASALERFVYLYEPGKTERAMWRTLLAQLVAEAMREAKA